MAMKISFPNARSLKNGIWLVSANASELKRFTSGQSIQDGRCILVVNNVIERQDNVLEFDSTVIVYDEYIEKLEEMVKFNDK